MSAILAMPIRIAKPDNALLLEVLDEAERRGYILITDGNEMRYTLPHFPLPEGWTRFIMKVKSRLPDPMAPRA